MGNFGRNQFLSRLREATIPLVIAHRGASALAPENTLLAARMGWEAGAFAWEFDVHLSRDGYPVVLHDESLRRTTDVETRFEGDPRGLDGFLVADFDVDEIQALDAGAWFLAQSGSSGSQPSQAPSRFLVAEQVQSGGVRVPTLAESLELTKQLGWFANIELKTFPNPQPALLERVLQELDRLELGGRVLISSFNHEDLSRARRLRPEIATGVLLDAPVHEPERYVRELVQADCAHPSAAALGACSDAYRREPGPARLRGDLARRFRERGIPILVYTINDARPVGLARHLADLGVSAMFSDRPGDLVRLLASVESAGTRS